MKKSLKKVKVAMTTLIIAVLMLQASNVSAMETTASEKALAFITDVMKLNTANYNVTLSTDRIEYPDNLGGIPQENVRYTLENTDSKLDVIFQFLNGTLVNMNLYVIRGSPAYATQPGGTLDQSKGMLQRLPNYSTMPYLQQMNAMLNTLSDIKNDSALSGNSKLITSIEKDSSSIGLIYSVNGIDFRNKGVIFEFRNGNLRFFADTWNTYKIGSDNLNVTEEKAISIAWDAVPKNYSFEAKFWNGTVANITGLNVSNNPIDTELQVASDREPLTLYPYWIVNLYYDQIYSGNFYGWTVYIWADTGEVFKVNPKLSMGDLTSENPQTSTQASNSNSSPTQSSQLSTAQCTPLPQTQDPLPLNPQSTATPKPASTEQTNAPPALYGIAMAIVIIIPISALALILRKRSK